MKIKQFQKYDEASILISVTENGYNSDMVVTTFAYFMYAFNSEVN